MLLRFQIPPIAKGRARFNIRSGTAYTPTKTRTFERAVKLSAIKQMQAAGFSTILGPVSVSVVFVVNKPKTTKRPHPIMRPDIDNFLKSLFDSLNMVLWKDDSQIIKLLAEKTYPTPGMTSPGIILEVKELI